jgi:hypothetical protein
MCSICHLIHPKKEESYFPFPSKRSRHILTRNEREKYYKKFTEWKITDADYIYGGLVDMLELIHGKQIDQMILEDEEQKRLMN